MNIEIGFEKFSKNANIPTKGSEEAACYDLYSSQYNLILPGQRKLIETDLSLNFPKGTYGQIFSRSSVSLNNYVDVVGGIIDSDYTGPIKIILHNNHSTESFVVNIGDRIAQIGFFDIPKQVTFNKIINRRETKRGNSGFGSSGK